MDLLLYIFIALSVLVAIGIIGVLVVKNPKVNNIIFCCLTFVTMLIASMGLSAIGDTQIIPQLIIWVWCILALLSISLKFFSKDYAKYSPCILIVAAIGSLISLFVI